MTLEQIARGQWDACHIGSCLRHKECMYRPCRNGFAQNSKGSQMSDELNVWREASDAASDNSVKWKPAAEERAAAVIRTYGDQRDAAARSEGYHAAIDDVVGWLRRDGDGVAGVSTPRMQTDNLAIILCNQFDNPDQQNDDDTGWTPDAVDGCDEAIGAIISYFANEITRRFGKDA